MLDSSLLLARNVHDVQGQEFTGYPWKRDVHMYLHPLSFSVTRQPFDSSSV